MHRARGPFWMSRIRRKRERRERSEYVLLLWLCYCTLIFAVFAFATRVCMYRRIVYGFENGNCERRSPANKAKHLSRVAAKYTQLLYHASKARSEKCAFVDGPWDRSTHKAIPVRPMASREISTTFNASVFLNVSSRSWNILNEERVGCCPSWWCRCQPRRILKNPVALDRSIMCGIMVYMNEVETQLDENLNISWKFVVEDLNVSRTLPYTIKRHFDIVKQVSKVHFQLKKTDWHSKVQSSTLIRRFYG